MCIYEVGYRYLVIYRLIDMWFGSSVVKCRDGVSEALGSNPGRAR